MRRAVLAVMLSAAAVLTLAQCSKTSADSDTACTTASAARCQQAQSCAPASFQTSYGGDVATCLNVMKTTCLENLAAPGNTNTPALLTQCASDLAKATCENYFLSNPPSSCVAPAGSRANGASCGSNGQCASSLCLDPKTSACGLCSAQPVAGDSCAQTGCGRALVCDTDGGTCIKPSFTAGATCSDSAQCGAGFACVSSGGASQCVAESVTVGSICDTATGGAPCSQATANLFCDTKGSSTCQKITWVGSGAACGYLSAGVKAPCSNEGFCGSAADAGQVVCLPPAANGTACDTLQGPNCQVGSKCILSSATGTAGLCQANDPSACD